MLIDPTTRIRDEVETATIPTPHDYGWEEAEGMQRRERKKETKGEKKK
jgi:hypothetical protein